MARARKTSRRGAHSPRSTTRKSKDKFTALEDLFKHELKDIYTGEHLLVDALAKLESESTDPKLAQAFAKHREETMDHIQRLETVGGFLGEDLDEEECPGIEGLIEEKAMFMKHKPSKELVQVFNIGAGQKSERYEITAYEGLIDLALKLGIHEAVQELRANLAEEEAALKTLKSLNQSIPVPA
jgi:ferritin-like metal-binding protein YciE